MEFDLTKIVDYMAKEVNIKFQRKEFKDFNYLKIRPTTTAVTVTYILVLLVTIGISIFAVKNEFDYND